MLDCSVSDINQVFSNFKNLQTEKRNLEKKLELIEGENDLLHEEIHEIKAMLENFQNKSDSSNNSFKHKKVSDVKTPQMEANLVANDQSHLSYKWTGSKTNSSNSISKEHIP